MDEIWKDIEGYIGIYQVSNLGRVKSLDRKIIYSDGKTVLTKGKILKGFTKSNGYRSINLYLNNIKKKYHIHRLVAQAFIPNPENKPEINHLDENRNNNCVDNLEWCTSKENKNYGNHNANLKKSLENRKDYIKGISQYDLNGNFIRSYISIAEASRITGLRTNSLVRCCKHHFNVQSCGGFKWEYYK